MRIFKIDTTSKELALVTDSQKERIVFLIKNID